MGKQWIQAALTSIWMRLINLFMVRGDPNVVAQTPREMCSPYDIPGN